MRCPGQDRHLLCQSEKTSGNHLKRRGEDLPMLGRRRTLGYLSFTNQEKKLKILPMSGGHNFSLHSFMTDILTC